MLHGIDVLILAVYIAYSIWAGVRGAGVASENLEEYFLAGRTLRGWQAGVSMAATQFAADTPLVVTGLIATAGVFSLWRLWIYALAFLFMALVLGTSWRRAGVVTDAQLTETRYDGRPAAALRGIKAVYFGLVFNCTVLAMVLLATTRITEPFLPWHAWLPAAVFDPLRGAIEWLGFPLTASGAPCASGCALATCLRQRCIGGPEWAASADNALSIGVIVLVTTLYSTTGGLRSVVQTDVVQFAIAMVATAVYAVVVLAAVGGPAGLVTAIHARFPPDGSGPGGMTASELLAFTPGRAHEATFAVVGVVLIQWIAQSNADGTGYLAQRTMACRSDRDARTAGVVFTILQILVRSLLWLPIGLGLLLLFPPGGSFAGGAYAAARETTYVRGIDTLLPPGVKGLMLTGMLGALASTLDTHLNWGSSYVTNDLYARFVCPHVLRRAPSPRGLVWVARLTNFVILGLALAIVPALDSIQTAWKTSLLLGSGIGIPLVLRWLWWRMNAAGELAALVASLVLAPLVVLATGDGALRLLILALGAAAASVATALLTRPESPERLRVFYETARPPGFWGPFAPDGGTADRRRLWRHTTAAFGLAFSLFCLLTGTGTWLIGAPAPRWLPWRSAWIVANLAIGLGTLPLWRHLAAAEPPRGARAAPAART
jgi:SSS family solute:Na+ symporter